MSIHQITLSVHVPDSDDPKNHSNSFVRETLTEGISQLMEPEVGYLNNLPWEIRFNEILNDTEGFDEEALDDYHAYQFTWRGEKKKPEKMKGELIKEEINPEYEKYLKQIEDDLMRDGF